MFVSTETIAIVISAASLMLAFFSAFGWLAHRIDRVRDDLRDEFGARFDRGDARIENLRNELGGRIDGLRDEFGARFDKGDARIDGLRDELGGRIKRVENELVDVKIAIARLEGPQRRFVTTH